VLEGEGSESMMVYDPIPPGELAGLQAFELRVGAYAGQRYPERPEWVELEGARQQVAAVESEWREEERLGYLVRLEDGRRLLLYYVLNEDLWSGVVLA
jgi:hypothetical protein